MKAKDIMRREVVTVRETDRVEDLVEVFVREHIHGAPVLAADGALAGVVTQQDIFFSTMTLGVSRDADDPSAASTVLTVGDIMTRPAVSVDETTGVRDLCRIMARLRIHRLPVVRDGKVTGLLSSLDVCRTVGERAAVTTATMDPGRLIAYLNSIEVGELDTIHEKLATARRALEELGQPALAVELDEATRALRSADLRTYRKRIETVISRLGHLR